MSVYTTSNSAAGTQQEQTSYGDDIQSGGDSSSKHYTLASSSSLSSSYKKRRKSHRPKSTSYADTKSGHALSAGEMRAKLFSSFKSKGVLTNLKSQLRTSLASAIKETEQFASLNIAEQRSDSLREGISDYLVAEHLKRARYEYSLSVFRTECSSSCLKLNFRELISFIKVEEGSETYQHLVDLDGKLITKSFLWDLISACCPERPFKLSAGTQTDEFGEMFSGNIEHKMMQIEEDVFRKGMRELESESSSLEARLFEFQKRMEAEKKSEIAAELRAFKAKELVEMRLYEKEKMRKEIETTRFEMEKSYKKLYERLQEKEQEADEVTRMRKSAMDQEAFRNRQEMLADIEALKERENGMKKSHNLAMQALGLEQAQAKAFEAELKAKEVALKSVEERYENKLQEELLKLKLEKQDEEQKHQQYMRAEETKLEVEKRAFEAQKLLLTRHNDSYERLKLENNQLQISLNTAMKKVSELTQKSDHLNDKLREFSDYHHVKEKSLLLAKEVELSKLKIKEVNEEKESLKQHQNKAINNLVNKLAKSPVDKNALQRKLERERLEFSEKEKELNEKYCLLEKKLHAEISKNRELNNLFDEKILQQKSMHREIEELKVSLRKLQSSSRQIPTPSVLSGRESTLWMSSGVPAMTSTWQGQWQNSSKLTETTRDRSSGAKENRSRNQVTDTCDDSKRQRGATFVRESKDIFEKLEKEAAELEKSYRNYQQKLRSQEPYANGKPNTGDYTVLEKYQSAFMPQSGDFMHVTRLDSSPVDRAVSTTPFIEESERNKKYPEQEYDLSDARAEMMQRRHASNNAGMSLGLEGDKMESNKVNNATSGVKPFVDTWNGEHLTEQLLASAVTEQDDEPLGGLTMQRMDSTHRPKLYTIDENESPSLVNQRKHLDEPTAVQTDIHRDVIRNDLIRDVDESYAVREKFVPLKQADSEGDFEDDIGGNESIKKDRNSWEERSRELMPEEKRQNSVSTEGASCVDSKGGRAECELTQYADNFDIEERRGSPGHQEFPQTIDESRDEEERSNIEQGHDSWTRIHMDANDTVRRRDRESSYHSYDSFDGKRELQAETDRLKEIEEKRLAFERERQELERLEREELEKVEQSLFSKSDSVSLHSDRDLQEEHREESNKEEASNVAAGSEVGDKEDEVKIDPLMQHYMQMIMKKRQQEPNEEEAGVGDTRSREEDLNLTDDSKLECKVSNQSDVTDLFEAQIENIEEHSDDEFQW
eukprot:gene3696-4215_t